MFIYTTISEQWIDKNVEGSGRGAIWRTTPASAWKDWQKYEITFRVLSPGRKYKLRPLTGRSDTRCTVPSATFTSVQYIAGRTLNPSPSVHV